MVNRTRFVKPLYHSQFNGQVERFVETLKRVLLKAKEEGPTEKAFLRFLLAYRKTPHSAVGEKSPMEVRMCRKIRTIHAAMLPFTCLFQPEG